MSNKIDGYSRRKFLKDSAIGIAVVGGGSLLAACQSNPTATEAEVAVTEAQQTATEAAVQPTTAPTATEAAAATAAPTAAATTGTDWLGTEPVIADSDISQTIETDVVVIGAGTGGLYAAASCLEKGLKVVVLEKNPTTGNVKDDFGAIDSKWQQAEGTTLDKATVLHYHIMYSANRLNPKLPRIWADESGAALDWYGNLVESRGAGKFFHEGGYEPDFSPTTYPKFPTGHSPLWNKDMSGAVMMQAYIEEMGGEFYFETPFMKFEHEDNKVTAAIAQANDGKYIRFVGAKGIILSTGGYSQNAAMMQALQTDTTMLIPPVVDGPVSGDGIKACLWMGAAMDETHSSMLFDRGGLLPTEIPATATKTINFHLGSQPFLKVNLKGERFTNESMPYDFILHTAANQPGKCYCVIMDATHMDQIQQFETVGCSRVYRYPNGSPSNGSGALETPEEIRQKYADNFAKWAEGGHLQQADTLEELATKLNIPADTFSTTVARYNELADAGEDKDFYKEPYRLIALKTPPYYGIRCAGRILCTMDGIKIDTQMRPLDADTEPFEGLHVIGDASGSYFSATYPNLFTGYANGRTLVYARRVARILAGEPADLSAAA